jgi:hypothetical protein
MTTFRRLIAWTFVWAVTLATLAAQPTQPAQTEFVPLDHLPPNEQMPGGVFVVLGYSFIWIAAMVYLWSIWRRIARVEDEIRTLQRRTTPGSGTR